MKKQKTFFGTLTGNYIISSTEAQSILRLVKQARPSKAKYEVMEMLKQVELMH